jgi:immune inhibitor A
MTKRTSYHPGSRLCAFLLAALLLLIEVSMAIPPTPEAIAKWKSEGIFEKKMANLRAFKDAGGCTPAEPSALTRARSVQRSATDVAAIDTIRAVVLLVDFSDWVWDGQSIAATPADFDSLLFSDRGVDAIHNPSGSLTDFYMENSYGTVYIQGEIYGWYRMPNTYAFYVGDNDGLSMGSQLARDAVFAANGDVDFSRFSVDGSNVDGVVIVHPGAGAESGVYGIWSHKSNISGSPILDGVRLGPYTINPEESGGSLTNIGVFTHEYGHVLGLPDLYDTDYEPATSEGMGGWSLMAGGSYNGGSRYPSSLDAWCKKQLGFVTVINVSANLDSVAFPAVEWNPVVYQIKDTNTVTAKEYWLVENRQPYGFDVALPGHGLCIYHIDENVFSNNNYLRYMVAMEQADGLNGLALAGSGGDAGDPFPGSYNKREFTDQSTPNSRGNVGNKLTEVGVWSISDPDSIMYADLDFTFSRPDIVYTGTDSLVVSDVAGGDGDGFVEPGETIEVKCRLKNTLRNAYNWRMEVSTDNPDVQFINNHTPQSSQLLRTVLSVVTNNPVTFTLLPGAAPTISDFTLTITADSVNGSGDERYREVFTFRQALGTPNILIVDDDAGASAETDLSLAFNDLRMPQAIHHKTSGTPSAALLGQYDYVFWMSGLKPTGILTAGDVASMKSYMDAGGNLVLASATAAAQLHVLDSAFLRDYFKVRFRDSVTYANFFYGVAGNPLSEDTRYVYAPGTPSAMKKVTRINPADDGILAFELSAVFSGTPYLGHCGVMYSGSYKSLFLTFPLEMVSISDTAGGYAHRDTLTARILRFFDDSTFSVSAPEVTRLVAVGENQTHVLNNTPNLAWSYFAIGVNTQDSAEIEVGTDNDWAAAELWDPSIFVSVDTFTAYGGSALSDGGTYYMRVRSHNGFAWSDWYQSSIRLNSSPGTPSLVSPSDGSMVTATPAFLTAQTVTDTEGDVITYQFGIYFDSALTSQEVVLNQTTPTCDISSQTLPENFRHWWRVRAYDGFEYSAWSSANYFWLNLYQNAPSAPSSLVPNAPTGLPIFDLKPTFQWSASVDFDPLDTVRYTVQVDEDPLFGSPLSSPELLGTSYQFPDSLPFGSRFYWRVLARDRGSLSSNSYAASFWTWRLGDLNHSHTTDLSDLSLMIALLTVPGMTVSPPFIADLSGDCRADLTDLSSMIAYMTIPGGITLKPGC